MSIAELQEQIIQIQQSIPLDSYIPCQLPNDLSDYDNEKLLCLISEAILTKKSLANLVFLTQQTLQELDSPQRSKSSSQSSSSSESL